MVLLVQCYRHITIFKLISQFFIVESWLVIYSLYMQKVLFGLIGVLFLGGVWFGATALIADPRETVQTGVIETPTTGTTTTSEQSNTILTTLLAPTPAIQTYTLAEIAQHNSASDCYTAINGSVYNLTSFVGQHPGGAKILKVCGIDGTAIFTARHGGSPQQAQVLSTLKIGMLAQ